MGVNPDASLFLPRPPAARPGGMHPPTALARLVALASRAQGLQARPRSAAVVAVNLPPVAAAADDHLSAAAGTDEQTTRFVLRLPGVADAV